MHKTALHRIPVVNMLIVRPRLVVAMLVAAALFFWLPDHWRLVTRLLAAWDAGAGCFLLLAAVMMARSDNKVIRRRAAAQDQGGLVLLGLTIFGAIASVAAIMSELATAKAAAHGAGFSVSLAAATVFLTWMFMQTMFALHYAHEYYGADAGEKADGGLEFPAHFHTPDYWDFVYFSFVIGTAAATADINLTSRIMRRIVTLHCVVVFFFNTTILALAINVGASLAS